MVSCQTDKNKKYTVTRPLHGNIIFFKEIFGQSNVTYTEK